MAFMKNLVGQICLAVEPEVEKLKSVGWTVLDEAEEAAHRAELALHFEMTSSPAQEAARIEAGVYDALSQATNQVDQEAAKTASEVATDAEKEVNSLENPVTPPAPVPSQTEGSASEETTETAQESATEGPENAA